MKLIIATPLYPPEIGGPATYTKLLEAGLPPRGIAVEIVKFSEVRHLPKFVRHYVYYRRVLTAARDADAVLALDPVSTGVPARYAAKKAKKPFVVKVVGDYAWEQGQQRFGVTETLDEFVKIQRVPLQVRLLRSVQTRVAAAATRVIVPSEYLKKIVMAWGIPADKIHVIYNAVLIDGVGAVPKAVTKLSRPLVVTAGRLVPWKHIDGVIDAVACIPETSLAIIGSGSERARLERLAAEKLSGRMVCTGTLSHADTLATIKSADVFVLNSSYEGLSHLLIEAVMLGIPIVATRAGGNSEVVKDGNGILVPVGDTPALTQAIRDRKPPVPGAAARFTEERMLTATAELLQAL